MDSTSLPSALTLDGIFGGGGAAAAGGPASTACQGAACSLAVMAGAILAGLAAAFLALRFLRAWARRGGAGAHEAVARHAPAPLLALFPLAFLGLSLPFLALPAEALRQLRHLHGVLFILAVAWTLVKATAVAEGLILARFDVGVRDNLRARAVHTQVKVFRNVVIFVVALLSLAAVLMTFDTVRQLGVSLLASAGVAGIILGFAAQRSIAMLLAGIQIAVTQPIRLDDVVIVEGEWGWIEEITLTYVVVRIWDLRRLVVPITYFTERPFQNWTRTSADILATVFLYVDYTFPVEELRGELRRVLEADPRWDGKVCVLQVTAAREQCLELRALMSAADSPTAWDLRCDVREKLVDFVKRHHPECLPRFRAEIDPRGAAGGTPPGKDTK
ncbi:mechanosensitive ion channel family protein [Dissulfurirhabdus thermomarina]|nr:mechanosensitive ion channel domain-containing protein [Dissulfurirhabdus thermomarina]